MSERGEELDQVMHLLINVGLPLSQDFPVERDLVKQMLGEGAEFREYFAAASHAEPIPAPGPSRGSDYGTELAATMEETEAWAARAGQLLTDQVQRAEFNEALGPKAQQAETLIDAMFPQSPPQ